MIKASVKLGIERMYFNIIKAVYDKPITNIILNGEKLKTFPLKSGMRQHSLGIASQSYKIRRRKKMNKTGKEVLKTPLFADDMILYLKDPKNT
jgi:hypothetical protein